MRQLILAALCAASSTAALATDPQVPYPEGYRDWHHVKSMVIEEGHPLYGSFGGIHHLYANDKAMKGYRKGTFSDGSVIIFDLLEAVHDGNAVTEGARKVVGVMHKDGKKFAGKRQQIRLIALIRNDKAPPTSLSVGLYGNSHRTSCLRTTFPVEK